jgi:hypothetical protein
MRFQVLTAGVFIIYDLLSSYTAYYSKMLKHPPEQNSVTLKKDTALPSEIPEPVIILPGVKTQTTI